MTHKQIKDYYKTDKFQDDIVKGWPSLAHGIGGSATTGQPTVHIGVFGKRSEQKAASIPKFVEIDGEQVEVEIYWSDDLPIPY